ncbi:helix-turn-helix domain-containing protein [Actinokineospora xionganensis]|uniref:Helix-turn-helix domain-containing protein n=1 Tax=Actinokineospora xionganensis TaxID=2684470 RepID=A0ABR7LAS9_9PSEU|nr:helix-turn-helix transcriptional regulator [Actinokineospora xionganensis]MBC6449392.1 helix-turn-helix domain-containing protein [Actinokineospora xionganensis]
MDATVRSRELGDELRRVRMVRGLKAAELAHAIGWSETKISRVESGKTSCSEVEAAIYLAYCRVTPRELDRIIALCGGEDEHGSFLRHHGERLPDQLRTLVLHETTADLVEQLELNRVPGLLQTEDYAREIIGGPGLLPSPAIEPRVRARMDRQTVIHRWNPPGFTFYIHEDALRLPIGGTAVMHEQMLQLLFLGELRHCAIQIIPTAAGAHAGLDGPFRMMRYEDHSPVVCVETQNRSLFMEALGISLPTS